MCQDLPLFNEQGIAGDISEQFERAGWRLITYDQKDGMRWATVLCPACAETDDVPDPQGYPVYHVEEPERAPIYNAGAWAGALTPGEGSPPE